MKYSMFLPRRNHDCLFMVITEKEGNFFPRKINAIKINIAFKIAMIVEYVYIISL
jgi:hypothetical protein